MYIKYLKTLSTSGKVKHFINNFLSVFSMLIIIGSLIHLARETGQSEFYSFIWSAAVFMLYIISISDTQKTLDGMAKIAREEKGEK